MYMMNYFLVNPAEGGTDDFIDIKAGYRKQWMDVQGAPTTMYISGHAPIGKHSNSFDDVKQLGHHGAGGAIIRDEIGPFSVTSVKASYSYHLPVAKDFMISLGAFAGVKNYGLNQSELEWDQDGGIHSDYSNLRSQTTPDIGVGIWGYSRKYFFGISTFQLTGSKLDLNTVSEMEGTLDRHFFFTAGYNFEFGDKWDLVPSFVVKKVAPAPYSVDLNAKLRYDHNYWLGISYRHDDAVIAMAGLTIKKVFEIGYAYDFTTTNINNYSAGTHEFVLGLRFPNHQHTPPPPQIW